MTNLITFEHATLTQADFRIAQDFDWLIEQNFAVFQIIRHNRQWQLKVRHYIGVIGLPSGDQLEILPKISQGVDVTQTRQWLQTMLTDIWQSLTPKNLSNISQQKPMNAQLPINAWLQQTFWQYFASYQPNQSYQQFEHNQPYLQGKLLVKQQLQYNHHQPHKFFHQRENLAIDTACNRMVKTTMQQIFGDAQANLNGWQTVVTINPNQYQMTFVQAEQELQMLPTVMAQQNVACLNFCYALLTLQQASGNGQSHAQAQLINMQFAFEKWVTYRIKRQFDGQPVNIFEQYCQALTVDHQLTIKPDLLITSENDIKVIDIKWKNIQRISDIKLSDMYQLITYAQQFEADEAWLVVPTLDAHWRKQKINLIKPTATTFYLMPFCLSV